MKKLLVVLAGFWMFGCDSDGTTPNSDPASTVTYVSFDSVESQGEGDAFALSKDGSTLAHYYRPLSSGSTAPLRIYNARKGVVIHSLWLKLPRYISTLELSADGRYLLAYRPGDSTVMIWDLQTEQLLFERGSVASAHFLGNGSEVAVLSGKVYVYSSPAFTAPRELTIPMQPNAYIYGVDASGQGIVLLPDATLDNVVIWNAQTDAMIRTFPIGTTKNGRCFFSNTHNILSGGLAPAAFFDLSTGAKIRELNSPELKWTAFYHDRAFTDTKYVNFNADTSKQYYSYISIHEMATAKQTFADSSRPNGVNWTRFSADGNLLALGGSHFLKVLIFN